MGMCLDINPGGPAARFCATHPRLVHRGVQRADAGAGGCLGGDRGGRQHAGRRADGVGQDAGRLPVGAGPAGERPGSRRPEAALPGALRLPAQGAGGGHRAEPARPADRERQVRGGAGCPSPTSAWRSAPATPRRTSAAAGQQAAGHPHHHPGVAVPDPDLPGPRRPARRGHGHRGRGARGGGQQAGRAPGALAGTPRRAAGGAGRRRAPAGPSAGRRPPGPGPPSGSGCRRPSGLPRRWQRSWAGPARSRSPPRPAASRSRSRSWCRSRTCPTSTRPRDHAGSRPGRGVRRRRWDRTAPSRPPPPRPALDLAARGGAGARPHRAAPVHHRLRQLPPAGRTALRPAQRARRRARGGGGRGRGGPRRRPGRRLPRRRSWPRPAPRRAHRPRSPGPTTARCPGRSGRRSRRR